MLDWRASGPDTVAALLESSELPRSVASITVQPNEVAVVIKDGEIVDVFWEGKKKTTETIGQTVQAVLGRRESNINVLIADTSPFKLDLWLLDPSDPQSMEDLYSFKLAAFSKDGEPIAGRLTLTLSVDRDNAENIYRMVRGRRQLTRADVANAIKGELFSKVLAPELANHLIAALKGNRELLRQLYSSIRVELKSTLDGYGLKLDSFYTAWDATYEEREKLAERRHASEKLAFSRRRELEDLSETGSSVIDEINNINWGSEQQLGVIMHRLNQLLEQAGISTEIPQASIDTEIMPPIMSHKPPNSPSAPVTCPPKTGPGVMLVLDLKNRGGIWQGKDTRQSRSSISCGRRRWPWPRGARWPRQVVRSE